MAPGIDVGSEMHYVRAFDYRGIEYSKKPFKFSNTEAGFETEVIWNLLIIGFNERDIYLYRRIHGFIKSGISRKSVSQIFCDDLQTEKVKNILYEKSG